MITLRTDHGWEYVNSILKCVLPKYRIIHKIKIASTPSQNGVVDRLIGTPVEKKGAY